MAIGVSDDSYMPRRYLALATAVWIMADSKASPDSLFSGVCTILCHPVSINAYWAELQGIHALLVALAQFCVQHHITSGGMTIGCNNQGALKQAQCFHEQVPCAQPHVDLIHTILALHTRSMISLTFLYIPGHQDSLSCLEDLSPLP